MRCLKSLCVLRRREFFECRCIREADAAPAIFSNVKAEWTPETHSGDPLRCSFSAASHQDRHGRLQQSEFRGRTAALVVGREESRARTSEMWKEGGCLKDGV